MMRYRSLLFILMTLAVPASALAAAEQDTPRARTLERAKREQNRFRALDTNKDGIITQREWRGGAAAFRQLDTDGDRELRGREIWFRLPEDTSAYTEEDQRHENMIEAFYRADRNRDSRLAMNEWWTEPDVFNSIDGNRDRVLTLGEFLYTEQPIDLAAGTAGQTGTESRAYQSGYQRGLSEGRAAGKEDKSLRNRWDLEGQSELEQADSGYTNDLGRREEYQAGYRAGFRLGYKQGFGAR
jgi:hypothetical protein